MPGLAERVDVLAVGLPGSGGSAALPPDVEPHREPVTLTAARRVRGEWDVACRPSDAITMS